MALKDDVERRQKSKGMGMPLDDHESDTPGQNENSERNQNTNKRKEAEINNIKVEILPAWERRTRAHHDRTSYNTDSAYSTW